MREWGKSSKRFSSGCKDKKRRQQLIHCGVGREAAGARKSHSKGGLIEKNRILCSITSLARYMPIKENGFWRKKSHAKPQYCMAYCEKG
jgi:hypothetical protein